LRLNVPDVLFFRDGEEFHAAHALATHLDRESLSLGDQLITAGLYVVEAELTVCVGGRYICDVQGTAPQRNGGLLHGLAAGGADHNAFDASGFLGRPGLRRCLSGRIPVESVRHTRTVAGFMTKHMVIQPAGEPIGQQDVSP